MELDAARAVLGLDVDAGSLEVREAFRRLVYLHHPDRNAASDAAEQTRVIVEAYRSLGGGGDAVDEPLEEELPDATEAVVTLIGSDTIGLACPSDEAFAALLEVAHRIGDVTYLDRQSELLEALLRTVDGTTVSMVISLQGRASGLTEAFVTLEPIDVVRGTLPSIGAVTALVADHAAAVLSCR